MVGSPQSTAQPGPVHLALAGTAPAPFGRIDVLLVGRRAGWQPGAVPRTVAASPAFFGVHKMAIEVLIGLLVLLQTTIGTPPDPLMPVGHEGRAASPPSAAGPDPSRVCDVTKFGAVGDNATEDTAAIAAAIAHCAGRNGGMVLLPAPGRYLSRPLTIGDGAHFRIATGATLVAWGDLKTWPSRPLSPPYRGQLTEGLSFLVAASPGGCNTSNASSFMSDVTIDGGGTIDAQGWRWWACVNLPGNATCYLRPRTLILYCINNLVVRDITIKDSPMFHIAAYGHDLLFQNVRLRSPDDFRRGCGYGVAPNTDGFNVGGSNIRILNSYVRNGDDCMPSGGDTHDYLAENVTCECGASPGIYMDEQHNITFRHLVANHTSHGANMKAVGAGGGTIRDVLFENLTIIDLPPGAGALVIDAYGQWSAPVGNGNAVPLTEDAAVPDWKALPSTGTSTRASKCAPGVPDCHSAANITYRGVTGTNIDALGYFMCREDFPCSHINLVDINLTGSASKAPAPFQCANVQGQAAANASTKPCPFSKSKCIACFNDGVSGSH